MAEKKTGLAVLSVVLALFAAFLFWTYGTGSKYSAPPKAGVRTPVPARIVVIPRRSPPLTPPTPRPTVANPALGDVNADGIVDRADVDYLTRFLFSHGPIPLGPADINHDGKVNQKDIFALIEQIREADAAAAGRPGPARAGTPSPAAGSAF